MASKPKPITGRHVLFGFIAAFLVILAANLAMVFAATGSFPGLVAKNSYVASQHWTETRALEAELGWRLSLDADRESTRLTLLDREGGPLYGVTVSGRAGRPADARTDVTLDFAVNEPGVWSAAPLGGGAWFIEIEVADQDGNIVRRIFRRGDGVRTRFYDE